MKCPIDGAALVMAERQGVEIDYCPTCRGVWLDRGELDKILDRAAEQNRPPVAPPAAAPVAAAPAEPRYDDRGYGEPRAADPRYADPRHADPRYRGQRKKKESWLSDLLDFG